MMPDDDPGKRKTRAQWLLYLLALSAYWEPGCTVSKCPHMFHSMSLDYQNVCTGKFLNFTEKNNENQFVICPINFYQINPYSESYYILSEAAD